jgi:hypothetical protein
MISVEQQLRAYASWMQDTWREAIDAADTAKGVAASSGHVLPPPAAHRTSRRRPRLLAIAAGILGVLLVAAAVALMQGDDDGLRTVPSQPTTTLGTVVLPDPESASLDGLEVSDEYVVATARSDSQVLVVDGQAGQPDGEPALRAWLAPLDDPAVAEVVDLSSFGPRAQVAATWWTGEFFISSLSCPTPASARELEDPSNQELCGSTSWDLIAFDPVTNAARSVLADVDNGERGSLRVGASVPDHMLIQDDGLALLTPEGEVEPVERPPGDNGAVCPIGDGLYAIAAAWGTEQDAKPLNDFFATAYRLTDGAWTEVALPPTPTMTRRVSPNCGEGGFVVDTMEAPQGLAQADLGAEILTSNADGELSWTTVPIDSMPPDTGGVRTIEVIDDHLTVEIALEPRDPFSDERPATSLFLWTEDQWEVLSDDVASWPLGTGPDVRVRSVIVADGTALLALDSPNELGERPVFRIYE